MRHLGSILLALLLAPVTWALTGIGVSKFAEVRAAPTESVLDLAVGLVAVLGAGFCYSLLVLPRLSPLGPVLAGLAYLALTGWRVVDPVEFGRTLPDAVLGVRLAAQYPADGFAALLAVPLVGTIVMPRRWRRYDEPPDQGVMVSPGYRPYPERSPQSPAYPPQPAAPGRPPPPGPDDTWPLPGGDPEPTRW